ncbi:large subunit ribosomal protein LP0, partial [Phenoliferia sp. Uapishka_3]
MGRTKEAKLEYFDKLKDLIESYPSIFIVNVDNVGSNQMHQIRQALRGKGQILMGKNTMVRRAVRLILAENPAFERFLPHVRGNVGFVFTSADLKEVRDIILANKVAAPAKAGAYAPNDVYVPAGNTGMEPGKTSFFQALNIPTKIARGTIEIVSDIHLVVAGTRVGSSEATLLNMLAISPFTYGMKIVQIYDNGQIFEPKVLDIEESSLIEQFLTGIKTIAAISLALNYPTLASVAHSLVNSYKNVIAVALETELTFAAIEELKDRIANPDAYAAAAPVAAAAAPAAAAAKVEEKEEEAEDSGSEGGFGDLFG